jgi:hypothetical protein
MTLKRQQGAIEMATVDNRLVMTLKRHEEAIGG